MRPLAIELLRIKKMRQATGHQRWTASAVSNGLVLKQIRACGACSWTTLSTFSYSRKFLSMARMPAPITTQSYRILLQRGADHSLGCFAKIGEAQFAS